MANVYLVNHTHWDREWYFTDMDAQVLADSLFSEVIEELLKEPTMSFTLDGQSSIVDEYVATHPEKLEKIRDLVARKQLFLGPWYTQTDAINVDAESIIRNAIIGILETKKKYGEPMMIGYLPDTFGFNANMPTLLKHVGLNNFIFWRGMNYEKIAKSPYFKWQAASGESVTAINLPPSGYSAAHMTDATKNGLSQYVDERLDKTADFIHSINGNQNLLLPVGMDQMNIARQYPETLKKINAISKNNNQIATYPDFIATIDHNSLPVYEGSLREPVYARVHRTIGSVRADLKLGSSHLEQKILKRLEPLVVIGYKNGIQVDKNLIIQTWKLLLESQAHDSLGGCVTDNVAVDIQHRFKQANELADSIENLIKAKLSEKLKLTDRDILLINTSAHDYSGMKTFEFISDTPDNEFIDIKYLERVDCQQVAERSGVLDQTPTGPKYITESAYYQLIYRGIVDIPALGYRVFKGQPAKQRITSYQTPVYKNDEIKITLNSGRVRITSNKNQYIDLSLTDIGNDGDSYDFSPLKKEIERELTFDYLEVKEGPLTYVTHVFGQTALPKDLATRVHDKADYRIVKYQLIITVARDNPAIDIRLNIDNTIDSHRMRIKIQQNSGIERVVSQIQAAFIEQKNSEIPDEWQKTYVEKPVNIFNFNKAIIMRHEKSAVSIITNDIREYEYDQKNVYLTLFSATSQLGKPDLEWRPGRASGDTTNRGHIMMATPLAELHGKLCFELAVVFMDCYDQTKLVTIENEWLTPNVAYQKQEYNKFLNRLDNKIWMEDTNQVALKKQSNLCLPKSLNVVAIYPAFTDNQSYVVRVVNLGEKIINIPEMLKDKEQINGLEEPVNSVASLKPFGIISFKMKL